jgi:general secretion pathway protein B
MSYILEALRKSERERQAGQTALPVLAAIDPAPPRRHWPIWIAALLVMLNGAGLGYLWLARWGHSEPPAQPAMAKAAGNTADTAPAENTAARGATAAQADSAPAMSNSPAIQAPKQEKSPAPARIEQPAIAQRADENADRPVIPPKTKPKPALLEKAERLSAQPAEKRLDKPAKKIRQPADPAPVTASAASEDINPPVGFRPPASTPEHRDSALRDIPDKPAIPFLQAMPIDFQQRVGPITINVFAYSEQPEERFAIIDMKKYRAGDRLQGGPELLEIRADSLVLRSEGRQFRVPRP